MTGEAEPGSPGSASAQQSKGCLWAFLGFVVIVGALTVASSLNGRSTSGGGSEIEAQVMCEQFIEDRLKAPSSAEYNHTSTVQYSTGEWIDTGTVDSENGFGAMLRSSFSCKIRETDDDSWRLLDISLN